MKCLKYCGCGYNQQCNYCNPTYFIGYDTLNAPAYLLFSGVPIQSNAPNSNGQTCSLATENVDVRNKFCKFSDKYINIFL